MNSSKFCTKPNSGGLWKIWVLSLMLIFVAVVLGNSRVDRKAKARPQTASVIVVDGWSPAAQASPGEKGQVDGGGDGGAPVAKAIRSALGLPAGAVMRDAQLVDPKHGVTCGMVSVAGVTGVFKRFVYVGMSLSGEIDDGSVDFEKYSAAVCQMH